MRAFATFALTLCLALVGPIIVSRAQAQSHAIPANDNEHFLKAFVDHTRKFEVPVSVESQPDCYYTLVLSGVGDIASLTFTNCPNRAVRTAVLRMLAAAMPMPVPSGPERTLTGSFHATVR